MQRGGKRKRRPRLKGRKRSRKERNRKKRRGKRKRRPRLEGRKRSRMKRKRKNPIKTIN